MNIVVKVIRNLCHLQWILVDLRDVVFMIGNWLEWPIQENYRVLKNNEFGWIKKYNRNYTIINDGS